MTSSTQTRHHAGHSHSHHHDNAYLTSSNRKDAGVRITRIGLYVNLGMAVGKGIGGYYFNSQALVADAFHALTDLVSDFMTLATVSWSLKPPTNRFPSGYGKIESLGAVGVSGLLLFGGVFMGLNACEVLYHQFFFDAAAAAGHGHGGIFGHSHSHGPSDLGPNINAAWLAAGSIVVKEYLYRATMKIAKERESSVLASNAVHHRIDSLTSIVALLAIGGSHFLNGATWLDPVGGLIVSLMVVKAGWGNTYTALLELADVGVDEEIKGSVRRAARKAVSQVSAGGLPSSNEGNQMEIRDIQGVKAGQNYLMDIELAVPGSWTLEQACEAEGAIRARVGSKVRGIRRVRIRFVPKEKGRADSDEFIGTDMSPRSSPEPEDETDERRNHEQARGHDHEHEREHEHLQDNGDIRKRK
ncbi:cation efflux family [Lasallia pustulata]|nr:cation efflux family [Lasallia pustulata]